MTLLALLGHHSFFRGPLRGSAVLALWMALTVLVASLRAIARNFARALTPAERCLIIADVTSSETIGQRLQQRGSVKAVVVARVCPEESQRWCAAAHSDAELGTVRRLATQLDVHRAIIAPQTTEGVEMLDMIRTFKAIGVRVSVVPRVLEVAGTAVEFDDLDGLTLMGVRRFRLNQSSRAIKRGFDLGVALVTIACAAPLILLAALAVKVDSPGPVLFSQERVGMRGRRFRMLKFRTMVQNAERLKGELEGRNEARDGLFKIAKDPRITRVGRLLRATSLDELPQLVNVLRGEMSIVGPRPLVPLEDGRVEGWHRQRLELTPGMTGHWQLLGSRRCSLQEMAAIDYVYVASWSLWTDMKIVLRTAGHVLGRRSV